MPPLLLLLLFVQALVYAAKRPDPVPRIYGYHGKQGKRCSVLPPHPAGGTNRPLPGGTQALWHSMHAQQAPCSLRPQRSSTRSSPWPPWPTLRRCIVW